MVKGVSQVSRQSDDPFAEVEVEWASRAQDMGSRLRHARVRAGLSQEQLGIRAGVSRNHVHLLETGRSSPVLDANPRLRMIYKLATALGIAPIELLPGDINSVPKDTAET